MAHLIDKSSDPEWIIADGVAVLDEHELLVRGDPEKGTKDTLVKITPKVLAEIAANNNRQVKETGDWVPLVEGHTTDGTPEKDQPEILGWADNFRVGPLFNTGRQAILCRFRIPRDPEKLKKVQNLPRRSVELWLDRREINPISLLGATAPERNLGLLRLMRMAHRFVDPDGKVRYRQESSPIRFQYPAQEMANQWTPPMMEPQQQAPLAVPDPYSATTSTPATGGCDPALVQSVTQALQQTDVWQQMQQTTMQMQQMMQQLGPLLGMLGGGAPGMGQPGMGGPGMGTPGVAGGAMSGGGDPLMALLAQMGGGAEMGGGGGEEEPQMPREEEEQVAMQAGGGYPGMGAYIPGQNVDGTPPMNSVTPDRTVRTPRITMARSHTDYMRAGETVEQALARIGRERDEAIKLSRQTHVANQLHALAAEGVLFDPQEEMERLQECDDAALTAELQRMRVRYQRRDAQQVHRLSEQERQPVLPAQSAAVGQRIPTGQEQLPAQQTTQGVDAPVTQEEAMTAVELIDSGALGDPAEFRKQPNPIGAVVRLMRSGQVARTSRNGRAVERVY